MREDFDYSLYPLDRAVVWLRFWPLDFMRNVVLVPDIDAYDMMTPSMRPGTERDFVLSGWSMESTFYDYHYNNYDNNFGMADYSGQVDNPELYYNIVLKRDFLNAFLMNLVPVLVISSLLFALLCATSGIKEKSDAYGLKASAVLSTCAGLLFASILSHTKLRSEFAAQSGIIYLEYFYFMIYFLHVLVPIYAFVVASKAQPALLKYRDGLLAKLLFWPVLLTANLALTLCVFH